MIAQLPLIMRWPRRQRFEYFHGEDGGLVVDVLQTFATTPGLPWIYLHGVAGTGKTHLLMATCQRASEAGRRVQYLQLRDLLSVADALNAVTGTDFLALDGVSAVVGDRSAEHALFTVYNRIRAERGALLFADRLPVTQLKVTLPDLNSRLGACHQLLLRPLTDAGRRDALARYAAARGMSLDAQVLDWLFNHHSRDLGPLLELLDRMDSASLAAQRHITIPFLRQLIADRLGLGSP